MRRPYIYIPLFVILFLLTSCRKQDQVHYIPSETDSIFNISHIQKIYKDSPTEAFHLVDSAEQGGKMPSWQADSLRARMCLDNYYDLNRGIGFALRTLTYDSVVNHPNRHLGMLAMISQLEVSLGRYSECIRFCDEGYALAEQLKDDRHNGQLMVNAGYSMYFMKEKEKGLDYLYRAQKLLSSKGDYESLKMLSYCYGQLMNCLWVDNTDEAIAFGKKREALLDSMENNIGEVTADYLDRQRGLTFAKMADFYARKKNFKEARLYEQKFLKTNISNTARGNNLIFDYYCTLGDFNLVQQTYQRSQPYWEHKDTFCTRYASVLGMLTKVYAQQGMLQKAFEYRTRQLGIKDSLLIRENENEAMRLSAIYQIHDKEISLEKKRADARHYLFLAGASILLLLLAIAFAIYFYHQRTRILRKNRLLISQLETISDYQREKLAKKEEEISEAKTDTDNQGSSTQVGKRQEMMVQKFRKIVDEEKAYLQLDFSREKLQRMMGISKNSLTPVLHEVLGDVANLSDYINSKRITHACMLIRKQPQMTVDNIATASGFTTTRNFRRCFKSQTGMTPAEYRDSILSE